MKKIKRQIKSDQVIKFARELAEMPFAQTFENEQGNFEQCKDLFRSIKYYTTMMGRQNNYYSLLDFRDEAQITIDEFEKEFGLTIDMKRFLQHRIEVSYNGGF